MVLYFRVALENEYIVKPTYFVPQVSLSRIFLGTFFLVYANNGDDDDDDDDDGGYGKSATTVNWSESSVQLGYSNKLKCFESFTMYNMHSIPVNDQMFTSPFYRLENWDS